jgi:tetratricopeptide (TPR) repeat protein
MVSAGCTPVTPSPQERRVQLPRRSYSPDIKFYPDLDLLERLSTGALDLIEAGRVDEAERMCQELKRRFPDQPDWIERAALLHEIRGELGAAIADYERCIAFAGSEAGGFDESFKADCRRQIDRLRGLVCKSRP